MENGFTVFAFVPDLPAAARAYARLLESGLDPADLSVLTHHDFAETRRSPLPELVAHRGGMVGHGVLLERLDPSVSVFEGLSQTLLGSAKKTGTMKAALLFGETLVAAQARSPAQLEAARVALELTDGLAA